MAVKTNPVQLVGFKEFMKMTKDYPIAVQKKIAKAGISKAASRTKTILKRAAPELSGTLKNSINVRRAKRGKPVAYIGPTWKGKDNRESYFGRIERGYDGKYAWFAKAIDNHSQEILQMILTQSHLAVYTEAKKSYLKSLKGKWK